MSAEENKAIIQKILSGEVEFMSQWADDGVWVIPGIRTLHGKAEIIEKLIMPMMAAMESLGRMECANIIAEGDYVVVEAKAHDRVTKSGKPYNNTYCLVYKMADGQIVQMTEYCDTALAKEALS